MEPISKNSTEALVSETAAIHTALGVTLFVLSIFILLGNLLTTISILLFTERRNTLGLLISALSLTEILNVLGPGAAILYVYFDKDKNFQELFTLCRMQAWLIVFLRITSSLLISLMGLDRIFASSLPHFYQQRWKGKIPAVVVLAIWIFAAFVATWPLLWLEGYRLSGDGLNACCTFPYNGVFAAFFVLFLFLLLSFSLFCFYSICVPANKKSFSTIESRDVTISIPIQQVTTRANDARKLSRMVALVILVYFIHIIPWMVAISLGFFSIEYPSLYGLVALHLPWISGFLNPLVYAITWPGYRRACIRALKWPCSGCGHAGTSSRTRSHSLNFTTATLTAKQSFWLSDGCGHEDAGQENAFDVFSGPGSLVHPLDFNVEELEMFEQNSQDERRSKLKVSMSRQKPVNHSPWDESGDQFQNILDLIDEMIDGKTRVNSKDPQHQPKNRPHLA